MLSPSFPFRQYSFISGSFTYTTSTISRPGGGGGSEDVAATDLAVGTAPRPNIPRCVSAARIAPRTSKKDMEVTMKTVGIPSTAYDARYVAKSSSQAAKVQQYHAQLSVRIPTLVPCTVSTVTIITTDI